MTKNSTLTGVVQPSIRPISSSEVEQMLQKMVPVIMHTRSSENPQWMPPTSNSIMLRPTVSRTKATEMLIRLDREWKNCSTQFSSQPMAAPSPSDRTTSIIGSTTTATTLT